MKQKKVRASAYDYFKGNTQGEDKNKQIFKRALKILKIIFYFCIFGITLTGCIQSFVIKTSTSSGSGTEFYKNKEDIIPNYTIFEATNKAGKNEITKATKSNNYLISEKDAPVLKQLRVQTEANGNTSNNYGQYSSLIMFHNADNTFEYAKGDKTHEFLFLNSAESKYDPKFNWTDIKLPSPKFFALVGDKYAEEFQKTQLAVNPILQNQGNFFYTVSNQADPTNEKYFNFSRDIIQYLYNKTMNIEGFKTKLIPSINVLESYKNEADFEKIKKELQASNDPVKKEALQVLQDYSTLAKTVLIPTRFTQIDPVNNTYSFAYNLNDNDYYNYEGIAFRSDYPNNPIVTWSDSWKLGPFYSLIVFPLSKIILGVSESQSIWELNGWTTIFAIIVVVLLTKIISFIFRFKTIFGQSKQIEMQAKKAKIDAKYEPYKKNKMMQQRHRQEVADLYKKNNFSPFAPFSQVLVTMPIFIAVWQVIQGIPSLKVTYWVGLELASISYQKLFEGLWQYLPILIIVVLVQAVQQLLPKYLNKKNTNRIMNQNESETMKKQQKTQRIISIVFIFFGVLFQASLQIYWIIGGLWEIGQTLGVHYLQRSTFFKEKMRPWLIQKKLL